MKLRNLWLITLILCLITSWGYSAEFTVSKEGGRITETVLVDNINGEAFISINDVLKITGGVKYWYPTTSKVLVEINGEQIELYLDHSTIKIKNNRQRKLSSAPRIYKGKVVVPLDFLTRIAATAAGKSITSNAAKQVIRVETKVSTILNMHYYSYPDRTRVVFETSKEYHPKETRELGKITYHFKNASVNPLAISQVISDKRVKGIQAKATANDVIIDISLNSKGVRTKVLHLKNPYRVVVDISGGTLVVEDAVAEVGKSVVSKKDKDIKPPLILPVRKDETPPSPVFDIARTKPLKTIVLDPGHGGKDPGALGYSGLREKDLTLAVAKVLKDLIISRLGIRVILTRNGDYFVPLRKRTEIANNNKADLFVSIHANASLRARASGFETYYLGKAVNEEARAVAALENAAIRYEKNKKQLTDLDFILWDMAQNSFRANSFEVANLVQKELDGKLSTENRHVKTAPFYVLNGAYMPAVLVELGFITNRKEEKQMKTWKHKKRLAEAIYNSVYTYKIRQERLLGSVNR